ncbi:hypothetical protein M3Y94_01306300 [Aphelenchoides besseyi]|nr:hypothetical protein M3Y94_01306300 [Aphelenchoides besseyi]
MKVAKDNRDRMRGALGINDESRKNEEKKNEETGEMNLEVLASTFNMKQTRSTDAEIESKLRSEIERRQQRRAEENRSNLIDDLELSESSNDEGGCSSSDEDDDLLASFNLT